MSWYIGLGRASCENMEQPPVLPTVIRVPDMDPPPSSALSLFILVSV